MQIFIAFLTKPLEHGEAEKNSKKNSKIYIQNPLSVLLCKKQAIRDLASFY